MMNNRLAVLNPIAKFAKQSKRGINTITTSSPPRYSFSDSTRGTTFPRRQQQPSLQYHQRYHHYPQRRSFSCTSKLTSNQNSSSSSKSTDVSTEDPASEYLTSLGYSDSRLQEGMKDALKAVFGNEISMSHLKSIGEEGLKALSESVIDQQSHLNSDLLVGTAHIQVPHHKYSFDIKMKEGENLMQSAVEGSEREVLGEYLECACGGNMSCATCHIILDSKSYNKLDPPTEAECDMLDLAYEPTETSRLGCQVIMTKELIDDSDDNGKAMVVTIPSGVNNFWN